MRRIVGRVVILLGSLPAVGCFPSFIDLSGGGGRDAAQEVEPESAACGSESCDCGTTSGCVDAASEKVPPCSGDGDCPDVLCDGQRCVTPAGFALQFSGRHVVRVAPGPIDDLTIEMWLKTKQTVDTDQWYAGAALYQADKPGPADDFGGAIVGDKFAFGTGNPDVTASSKTPINTGEWFHVAATRVKSTGVVRIFVNGALENILTTGNTMTLADAPSPWIGGVVNGPKVEHPLTGIVDELRVWNIARTGAELSSTMHSKLRGDEPGLIGYWRFDEGVGLVAGDLSPSRNDGALGYGLSDMAPEWVASDAPITQ